MTANTDDRKRSGRSQLIDENLRRVFQETLDQEVPERFQTLLAQLRAGSAEDAGDEKA